MILITQLLLPIIVGVVVSMFNHWLDK
ncbi:type I toxin-antitoxin system Fst family toxin [Nicoliella lavandulae]|uniref:Type I toxin-antitoxin system Fst family toxin n=1 Tax=Nicoliella lavandulae TaxID=3082954 RepID=A0ABU8SJ90_9LACO